ncbi:MAG: helix-turn-helix domain-containing protein [Gammaproteobacteria bacterium]|nr:helix-turn-helix domain-containing protein [Gammaproteobacteria bacterium]
MLNKELASLWEESLKDEDFRFELKAQDVAVKLANAVALSGMTQKELADKLGWKTSRMSKVLHGASNLTLKTMFQVCEALGIDFDVHFGGKHHLNEQVEVINARRHEVEAILKTARQLNSMSWNRYAQVKTFSRVAYGSDETARVACP